MKGKWVLLGIGLLAAAALLLLPLRREEPAVDPGEQLNGGYYNGQVLDAGYVDGQLHEIVHTQTGRVLRVGDAETATADRWVQRELAFENTDGSVTAILDRSDGSLTLYRDGERWRTESAVDACMTGDILWYAQGKKLWRLDTLADTEPVRVESTVGTAVSHVEAWNGQVICGGISSRDLTKPYSVDFLSVAPDGTATHLDTWENTSGYRCEILAMTVQEDRILAYQFRDPDRTYFEMELK